MRDPLRWKLVGLETVDGDVLPDGAYAVETDLDQSRESGEYADGREAPLNGNGQVMTCGRVTSTYYSPTLGRGIAMGLVERGPDRMGETLDFPTVEGDVIKAKIVSPVFYDPDGEKQDV